MWNLWVKFSLLILLLFAAITPAQLTLWEEENLETEVDIYLDAQGNKYSDMIILMFTNKMFNLSNGDHYADIEDMLDPNMKSFFATLEYIYGELHFEKVHPWTNWGETTKTNIRTNENVTVPDLSQIYRVYFEELINIDNIINDISNNGGIEYVEGPTEVIYLAEPNDPYYTNGDQWNLEIIDAPSDWDYTLGDTSIIIAAMDYYKSGITTL